MSIGAVNRGWHPLDDVCVCTYVCHNSAELSVLFIVVVFNFVVVVTVLVGSVAVAVVGVARTSDSSPTEEQTDDYWTEPDFGP